MRLIVTYPHSLGAPGGGTQDCLQLVKHLARDGVQVVLLPIQSLGPARFPRPRPPAEYDGGDRAAELADEGIEVHPVACHPLHYGLDARPMKRAVMARIAERPVDALLGWWNETVGLSGWLRRRGTLFAMNAAASYGPLFSAPGAKNPLRRLRTRVFLSGPLRAADVVFARSDFTRDELVDLVGVERERIRVAHLGVDPVFGDLGRGRSDTDEPITRLLFSGTLVREKGLFEALEALARLKDRPWTFRLIGWGDADFVRRRAAELGIEERLELPGRLERPALLETLAWAQLALQPSHTESFGLANAEAQAAGVPVVACAVGAVPEVVLDGETGWLVPKQDVTSLAGALEEALADPRETRRRGRAGHGRVTREFRWERTAETTLRGLEEGLRALVAR